MARRKGPATGGTDTLIGDLVAELRAAPPLAPPTRRAGLWLVLALLLGGVLVALSPAHVGAMARLSGAPDLWLSFAGAALTSVAAAVAAFHVAVPDRSARWGLLPLPFLALWLGASTAGCLRPWVAPAMSTASMAESGVCFQEIIMVSLPLSLALAIFLRLAKPLRPVLTAMLAGLAAAAASASVLALLHPFDATAADVGMHLAAIILVVGLNVAAARWLGAGTPRPGRN